jgi:hypothetical protein
MVQQVKMNNGQVIELEDDKIATLIQEVQGEERCLSSSSSSSSPYRPRIVVAKAAASPLYRQSWCWTMTVLLASVVILLMTDTIQVDVSLRGIQQSTRKSGDSKNNAGVPNDEPSIKPPTSAAVTSPAAYPIRYRGPQLAQEHLTELAAQWGQWSLADDSLSRRPVLDCGTFAHCDIPRSNFPARAWQTDATFLERFLTQGLALVTRAQEAILAEYGHSQQDQPNVSFQERSAVFQLSVLDLKSGKDRMPGKKDTIDNGGWTTSSSFQGLVRRVLHAIVTQDTFTFAMGGHSSATGHG